MRYRIIYSRNGLPMTQYADTHEDAVRIANRFAMCGYTVDVWEEVEKGVRETVDIDNRLKPARQKVGLSQTQLAEKLDISLKTIQDYEQNRKSLAAARADTVIKMAHVLKVKPEYLIKGGK